MNDPRNEVASQGFRKFCKVADIFVKAPRVTFFGVARCLAPKVLILPRGVWGHVPPPPSSGKCLDRTLRNTVSSVSGTQESVSQARLEFTQIIITKN